MRLFQVLSILAIVALFAGIGFLGSALNPKRVTITFTIPAGSIHVARWDFDVVSGGSASGSFLVSSGGDVELYVMTQSQHEAFLSGRNGGSLAFSEGPSGNFTAVLPSAGRYSLVIAHAADYTNVEEQGLVAIRISAIHTWPFIEGFGGVLAGGTLGAIAYGLRTRYRRIASAGPPPEGGVVFFDSQEPPSPPSR